MLKKNMEKFWSSFDALNSDFTKYIDNWKDIAFYNELNISPYGKFDSNEYVKAIVVTDTKKAINKNHK